MNGNLGGYNNNLNNFHPNISVQRPPTLPQSRHANNLPEQFGLWEPPVINHNATVSGSIQHNHGQQSNTFNNTVMHNLNRREDTGVANLANGQYGTSLNSTYNQMPPLRHASNGLSSTQFLQNSSTSHSSSNYAQYDPGWTASSNQASNCNQNYNAYRPTVIPVLQSNHLVTPDTQPAVAVNSRPVLESNSANISNLQSDCSNWRDTSSTSSFNTSQMSQPMQKTYPATAQIDWKDFKNPLSDDLVEENTAEVLVNRMHQAAGKSELILEQTTRKPNSFSKSALALLESDLKKASMPFQSAAALKQFRNLELGISPDDNTTPCNENSFKSNLSVSAIEFVPRNNSSAPVEQTEDSTQNITKIRDSENATNALHLIDGCIGRVTCEPDCFDDVVPNVIAKLREFNLVNQAISMLVDKIYAMCVREQNFRFLGSQLCDKLSRTETGLPGFRSVLLEKAQEDFKAMDTVLKCDAEKARNFTHFMAELFLNLMCEKEGSRERFAVLGRATCGAVQKLIDQPNNDNIQCAIRVLKLTVVSMEDSLNADEPSMEKLKSVLNALEGFRTSNHISLNDLSQALLDGFIKLRANDWGRISKNSDRGKSPSQHANPEVLSKQDENYFMNEPVFFTPTGVMYTTADTMDPEFYCLHLANNTPGQAQHTTKGTDPKVMPTQQTDSFYRNPLDTASPTFKRMPYTNWTFEEAADCFDDVAQEDMLPDDDDDYDQELEEFLKSIGQ